MVDIHAHEMIVEAVRQVANFAVKMGGKIGRHGAGIIRLHRQVVHG